MLPEQRELVKAMAGKPFTLLGVNSDQDRSVLKQGIEKGDVTWPNIYDGWDGPICKQWNVRAFPTIYVIDHEGIIRRKGHMTSAEMKSLVEEYVAKIKASG